jgi:CP family cyanate transporter-like MFS transporter
VHKDGLQAFSSSASDHAPIKGPPEHPVLSNSRWYLVFSLFLVALNLRPALSSIAPVLAAIRTSTGLSSTGAGVLTTLPVLCFGVFAPLAPRLVSRFCPHRVVLLSLFVLAAGIGARVLFDMIGLFIGTLVAGASIGVIMVLLPSIIKADFSRQAGGMMGVYSMAMCLGAAMSAGLTVPLEQLSGNSWRMALAFWLLPALIAAIAWWPRIRRVGVKSSVQRYSVDGLWRSSLAWQVAAFLGLQSALAYCVFGWLPTILIDRGMTPLAAGAMLSLTIAMQLLTALGGPWLAGLGRDQRLAIAVMMIVVLVSFVGCVYADTNVLWAWASALGLGLGGTFSIALTLIVLRAPNPTVAASLSGMAQGAGYTVASVGPLVFGLLRDISHDWRLATMFFILVGVAALIAGLAAGRDRYVDATLTEIK